MRPIWKGLVTFGLVSFPVGLYSATRRQAELPFRLLHHKDQAPIDRLACRVVKAERDVGATEPREDVGNQPRFMAHLERRSQVRDKQKGAGDNK